MTRSFCKKLHNGCFMYVDPSEHIQQSIFWYGYYEKEAVLTWETLAGSESTVVDIGANTGYYSIIAAPRARHVYAFEPSAHSLESLRKNILLNQFSNVFIHSYAVSDETSKATLYLSDKNNTGMSGLTIPENFSGVTEIIQTIRLDDWAISNSIPRIDLIKIDVEGAEMKVLSGMKELIEKYHPAVFIEVMNDLLMKFGAGAGDVYQYFSGFNYTGYEIIQTNQLKPVTSMAKQAYTILFLHRDFIIPAPIRVV